MISMLAVVNDVVPFAGVEAAQELLAIHPDKLSRGPIKVRVSLVIFKDDDVGCRLVIVK
jgi:hypothetical protein